MACETEEELQSHVKKAHRVHKCGECGKVFEFVKTLTEHEKNEHPKPKIIQKVKVKKPKAIKKEPKITIKEDSLTKEEISHDDEEGCSVCHKIFDSLAAFARHVDSEHGKEKKTQKRPHAP